MTELQFTQDGDRYVSEAITASEVTLHLKFANTTTFLVERTADEANGWAEVATRTTSGKLYEETVVGIPEGVKVRVNAPAMPTLSQCITKE